jgi:exodeoxyribonuclease-3
MPKIASWNVNSLKVRLPQVLDWLREQQPDILALQETKLTDPDFPTLDIARRRLSSRFRRSENLQRRGGAQPFASPARPSPTCRDWTIRNGGYWARPSAGCVSSISTFPTVNPSAPTNTPTSSNWLDKLAQSLETELARHPRLIALGDFNIAPEDRDVHDPAAWAGQILCSDAERAAFRHLLDLGLQDAFRRFPQEENIFSWWDYRAAGFRRNLGLRIDHLLLSPALAATCTACWVDKAPRRLERPSDHAPVIAEFDLELH